jgi:hypothetical protein
MVGVRSGSIVHQGFTGADLNPDGIVTVRTGGNETGLGSPGLTSAITLDYTGRNADNVRWLQFVNVHMSARPAGAHARTFQTGTFNACGGGAIVHHWSTNVAPVWEVDSCSAADPFYDASFINLRTPHRSMLIADQPGGFLHQAQSFAATFATPPTTVTATFNFDSYAINNGTTPIYHVRWGVRYTYNITAGTESAVRYNIPGGGPISRLSAPHRTAIDTRNPGNGIL